MTKPMLLMLGIVLGGLVAASGASASVSTVASTVNIAAAANGGKIVGFSSEALDENKRPIPEWQINNLLDGRYVVGNSTPADSYGWSSAAPPSDEKPEWFTVGFTNPDTGKDITHLISRVVIDPTTDDPLFIGRWVQGITVQVSVTSDKGPWATVGRYLVVNRAVKQTFDFPPTEARYVRVLITSNHGSDRCVEMGEFEVYEAIIPGEQLSELIIRLENLLNDLKRYRDGQLYKIARENTTAVTTKPPAPGTPEAPGTPATPVTPATPAGPEVATPLDLGALSLILPPDWSQAEGIIEGSEHLKLVLNGPEVGGAPLVFTVEEETLAGQVALTDFVSVVADRWRQATPNRGQAAKLGGAEAWYLEMVKEGQAYLMHCIVKDGKGIVLTAVAPATAVDDAQKALGPLLASVKWQ